MKYPIHCFNPQSPASPLPEALWNIPDPPNEIYLMASDAALKHLENLPDQGLAVVGTRNPQARSNGNVEGTISRLSGSGLIILSGMARGIDATAHRAALKASLPTIAILGHGVDLTYPAEHDALRRQILAGGGILASEFPPGMPALRHHFLRRNRLIAGWAKATWVVEASFRSGALNTARWAREQNRICFATPCFPGDPALAGNQVLLDRDHSLPFWNIHSLGAAWLNLATWPEADSSSRPCPESSLFPLAIPCGNPDAVVLAQKVKIWTTSHGGARVDRLLDWALQQKWSPKQFFLALREALHQGWIQDRQGTLAHRETGPDGS